MNTFRRSVDFGSNKEKLVKWLEKRENKTVDEIKALRCAKKNNRMWVGIGFFVFGYYYCCMDIRNVK